MPALADGRPRFAVTELEGCGPHRQRVHDLHVIDRAYCHRVVWAFPDDQAKNIPISLRRERAARACADLNAGRTPPPARVVLNVTHGRTGYERGCRCPVCTEAVRAEGRRRRAKTIAARRGAD